MSNFETKNEGDVLIIKMPSVLSKQLAEAVRQDSQSWMLESVETFVLDFTDTRSIENAFYQSILALAKTLKANKKQLISENVSSAIKEEVKNAGLSGALGFGLPRKQNAKVDVRLINPFLTAVQKVFSSQTSTKLTPLTPSLRGSGTTKFGIIGLIALNCKSFQGTIALCFPKAIFLKIYERMVGEVHEDINAEIEDAVAELLNIIYGIAKVELNEQHEFDFQPSIPAVLRGEKISLRQKNNLPVIVLPFESDIGQFQVEISAGPIANEGKKVA